MNLFKNLNIGKKILFSFLAVLLVMVITSGYYVSIFIRTENSFSIINDDYMALLMETEELVPLVKEVEKEVGLYIGSFDSSHYDIAISNISQLEETTKRVKAMIESSKDLQKIGLDSLAVEQSIEDLKVILDNTKSSIDLIETETLALNTTDKSWTDASEGYVKTKRNLVNSTLDSLGSV